MTYYSTLFLQCLIKAVPYKGTASQEVFTKRLLNAWNPCDHTCVHGSLMFCINTSKDTEGSKKGATFGGRKLEKGLW